MQFFTAIRHDADRPTGSDRREPRGNAVQNSVVEWANFDPQKNRMDQFRLQATAWLTLYLYGCRKWFFFWVNLFVGPVKLIYNTNRFWAELWKCFSSVFSAILWKYKLFMHYSNEKYEPKFMLKVTLMMREFYNVFPWVIMDLIMVSIILFIFSDF